MGSDDAICHIGTGLHKIALARVQEVFLLLEELLAGRDENVDLQIAFAIVAVVPNPGSGGLRSNPQEENCKHVLELC